MVRGISSQISLGWTPSVGLKLSPRKVCKTKAKGQISVPNPSRLPIIGTAKTTFAK